MRYLRRLWTGRVDLPITFWFWNLVVTNCILGVAGLFAALLSGSHIILIAWLLIILLAQSFMTVSIWRSAGLYLGFKLWKWLARFWVITLPLRLFISLGTLGNLVT